MKNLLLLFSFITIQFTFSQTLDCSRFKDGTFQIKGNNTTPTTTLQRIGNKQLEWAEGDDNKMEFDVEWLSSCSYVLSPSDKTSKEIPGLTQNMKIKVQILEIKTHSYIQESSSNFSEMVLKSEVHELKKN